MSRQFLRHSMSIRKRVTTILSGNERYDRAWSGRNFLDAYDSSRMIRLVSTPRSAIYSSKIPLVYVKYSWRCAILQITQIIPEPKDTRIYHWWWHDTLVTRNWNRSDRNCGVWVLAAMGARHEATRMLVYAMDAKEKYSPHWVTLVFIRPSISRIYLESVIACNVYTCSMEEENLSNARTSGSKHVDKVSLDYRVYSITCSKRCTIWKEGSMI
jgi:hypothetical protein